MEYSEADLTKRINQFLSEHSKPWSKDRWIRIKEDLRDCVWVEGALLAHQGADCVYFAPEPTQFGLIYEIHRSDIKEALPTGQTRSKLGDDYEIVRVYVHKDAILVRMEWCLASTLPAVMRTLRQEATESEKSSAGAPLTAFEVPNGGGKGGGGSPTPEPKGGGGGSSSGVRG
jgi:hypothetical protein